MVEFFNLTGKSWICVLLVGVLLIALGKLLYRTQRHNAIFVDLSSTISSKVIFTDGNWFFFLFLLLLILYVSQLWLALITAFEYLTNRKKYTHTKIEFFINLFRQSFPNFFVFHFRIVFLLLSHVLIQLPLFKLSSESLYIFFQTYIFYLKID